MLFERKPWGGVSGEDKMPVKDLPVLLELDLQRDFCPSTLLILGDNCDGLIDSAAHVRAEQYSQLPVLVLASSYC